MSVKKQLYIWDEWFGTVFRGGESVMEHYYIFDCPNFNK